MKAGSKLVQRKKKSFVYRFYVILASRQLVSKFTEIIDWKYVYKNASKTMKAESKLVR